MRFIAVRDGIMERINNILGTDNVTSPLNTWSLQAAMIENFNRIIKTLNQQAPDGSIAYGLTVTPSGKSITVGAGIGLTPFGRMIMLRDGVSSASVTLPDTSPDDKIFVYLMYTNADSVVNEHESPIIQSTAINISKDEKCSGTTIGTTIAEQISCVLSKKTLTEGTDGVLIATLTTISIYPSYIYSVEKNIYSPISGIHPSTTYLTGDQTAINVAGVGSLICSPASALTIKGFNGGVSHQILHIMNTSSLDVILNNEDGTGTQKIKFNGSTLTLTGASSHYQGVVLMYDGSYWGVLSTTGTIA